MKQFEAQPLKNDDIIRMILDKSGDNLFVKMDSIAKNYGLKCQLIAKCDFFQMTENVRDRISNQLIEAAEKSGILKQGHVVIHPVTEDNDIGIALTAVLKGYRTIIVTNSKRPKMIELEKIGAEIIIADDPVGEAKRFNLEISDSHILKFQATSSPAFYGRTSANRTALEIFKNFNWRVLDMIVLAAAPGNDELVRVLKEKWPSLIVVGVIPYSATYTSLDGNPIDKLYEFHLNESLEMVHSLVKLEGIPCGPDSGSVMLAAIKEAQNLNSNQHCIAVLPDTIHGGSFFLNKWWPKWNQKYPNKKSEDEKKIMEKLSTPEE